MKFEEDKPKEEGFKSDGFQEKHVSIRGEVKNSPLRKMLENAKLNMEARHTLSTNKEDSEVKVYKPESDPIESY